ncbi:MAG: carboxymuconolactone decarboxylase family protein [Candidatus Latescibacterota bacterium]|jgi:alkyl hydroperoxide reductase subunit D
MGVDAIRSAVPDYAKDLRLNLGSVITTSSLEPVMAWGSALTAALVCKNTEVIQGILEDAKEHLDETHLNGVKAAAAIMSMNNVWYKFTDLVKDEEVKKQPAKLRMNVMMNHGGVSQALFEGWSLAASVVNACGVCVNAHAAQMRKQELSAQNIVDIGRIAAVIKAVSDTLSFEKMLSA